MKLYSFSLPGATFVIADVSVEEARSAAREYIRKFLPAMDPAEADRCEPAIVPVPGWFCIRHPDRTTTETPGQHLNPPARG